MTLNTLKQWKPYPTYKPSGVDWLGDIPDGWDVLKLKNISNVNLSNVDKKSIEDQETVSLCNYTDVYYNDYITNDLSFMVATASYEQIRKFTFSQQNWLK